MGARGARSRLQPRATALPARAARCVLLPARGGRAGGGGSSDARCSALWPRRCWAAAGERRCSLPETSKHRSGGSWSSPRRGNPPDCPCVRDAHELRIARHGRVELRAAGKRSAKKKKKCNAPRSRLHARLPYPFLAHESSHRSLLWSSQLFLAFNEGLPLEPLWLGVLHYLAHATEIRDAAVVVTYASSAALATHLHSSAGSTSADDTTLTARCGQWFWMPSRHHQTQSLTRSHHAARVMSRAACCVNWEWSPLARLQRLMCHGGGRVTVECNCM